MNAVMLIGRITKDLELKFIRPQNGEEFGMLRFTIAIDDGFGDNKRTNFIPCFATGKIAENMAKYCKKGSLVAVEGKIVTGKHKDKNDNDVYTTDVKAETVQFLDKKETQSTVQTIVPENKDVWESAKDIKIPTEELPFY